MPVAIEQLTTLGLTPWFIWAPSPHPLNEESGGCMPGVEAGRGSRAGRLGNSKAADPCHPSTHWRETEMKQRESLSAVGQLSLALGTNLLDLSAQAWAGSSSQDITEK